MTDNGHECSVLHPRISFVMRDDFLQPMFGGLKSIGEDLAERFVCFVILPVFDHGQDDVGGDGEIQPNAMDIFVGLGMIGALNGDDASVNVIVKFFERSRFLADQLGDHIVSGKAMTDYFQWNGFGEDSGTSG